ncbi:hypothetical protein EIP86_011087, partial [Pleurotus ostreatoroseus]
MSSSDANKLSFTIRRPTPVSRASSTTGDSDFKTPALPRHLSNPNSGANSPLSRNSPKRTYDERDSSDEDEQAEDELVTGFDQFGVQRCVPLLFSFRSRISDPQLTEARVAGRVHEKKKPEGPLVIPALQNRDWREQARKRRNLFVPNTAPVTGADGSVGGLGTRDSINSGPQLAGLQVKQRVKVEDDAEVMEVEEETEVVETAAVVVPKEEENEDQRALRALLASAKRDGSASPTGPQIDIIPAVTEDAAYQQDVQELPESATLEDYERVPVSQFGAALLRGMGWKEGTGASRTGKGPVQPYLPQSRPALLGIGAKEREQFDDGSKRKKGRDKQKYVPVLKRDRPEDERGGESREGGSSRRRTPSPDRRRDRDRDRNDSDHDRYRDKDRRREKDRDGESSNRDRDRKGDREEDRERRREDRDHRDRDYDSSSRRDRDRDHGRRDRSFERSQSRRDRDRRDPLNANHHQDVPNGYRDDTCTHSTLPSRPEDIDEFFHVPKMVSPGETLSSTAYTRRGGGKGANQAVAVARAGGAVTLVGAVGRDGTWLVEELRRAGVDVDSVVVDEQEPTGRAIIQLTPEGENSIILHRGANYASHATFDSPASLEYTHLLLQNEIPFASTLAFLSHAHASGAVPLFNPSPLPTDEQLRAFPWASMEGGWLLLNEGEAWGVHIALSHTATDPNFKRQADPTEQEASPAKRAEKLLLALHRLPAFSACINLVCTLGPHGAVAVLSTSAESRTQDRTGEPIVLHVSAAQLAGPVIDTTGAGDCFTGYLVAALMETDCQAQLQAKSEHTKETVLQALLRAST